MRYDFKAIEEKWQQLWRERQTYRVDHHSDKPKFYVLDMFPYPSGAGLHVGHPLGYIASDIYARYKRLKGFNVLHPMGYDAFGLPAEQYAIQTGQHPAVTTAQNLKRYREQLDRIGFSYDWDREVRTSDPAYYKWTQWIFIQLFECWFNQATNKAEPIATLVEAFERGGSGAVDAACEPVAPFSAEAWRSMSHKDQQMLLLNYRLTYLSETMVNWCPALGTVLANEEVKDGVSERGGHPVERKRMRQWSMRITAYADRLLQGLEKIDWPDSLKEIQRNWIGRSEGASMRFKVKDTDHEIEVFTTRPDTIFGASFMVLAPEHALVSHITTAAQRTEVELYVEATKSKLERDRLADVKTVSGAFTGSYAVHPFSGEPIPIWIGDYVLASYGTGAVMAVPSGDQRDWDFARHFQLPIPPVIEGQDVSEGPDERKDGVLVNSGLLDGLQVPEAIKTIINEIEAKGIGHRQVNFRMRDAIFSRQRYWGEPFPIYFKDDVPYAMPLDQLPLELPEVDKFLPTETGDPPLGRAKGWTNAEGDPLETNTMPGWAGSSWYYLRYMDARNEAEFVSKEALDYWGNVDLYLGGAEHATGHLLYVRFWTHFLHDLGLLPFDEPAKKLINQGMILAEDGQKMSKRYGNVVNPDDVIDQHGADAFRLHEMFLGPIEMHKPWNTKGIEGTSKFLKKLWRLYHDDAAEFRITEDEPTLPELKALHKAIKKVEEDNERFSFNTVVSTLMVCVNELTDLGCAKRAILEPLAILAAPHAPHIAEELWALMGHEDSITQANWPALNAGYLVEDSITYPVSFNGKMRFKIEQPVDASKEAIEAAVLAHEAAQKWLDGKAPKRVIVVPKKIVNVVV